MALLIHALREGSPDVSQEASRALEESGEIEVFKEVLTERID